MTNRSHARQGAPESTPHDDFHFSVAATFREWTGGRITEDAAMEAIGNALAELRDAQNQEGEQQ